MKKILIIMLAVGTFLLLGKNVYAEEFVEGSFISGEYINKEKNNKTYYMTMQFIKDSKGRIVYCLEPFVEFETGKKYTEYSGDLSGYKNLTDSQKRRISLLVYYGYGYGNRTSNKWYVVTQYMIWKTVDSKANIYFTSTLNGNKITKYTDEINELEEALTNHDKKPSFIKDYVVDYEEDLTINGLGKEYEIVKSDYKYEKSDVNTILNKLKENGSISLRKLSNYYDGKVVIFDSSNSQDLIRPGNVDNDLYKIDIKVNKGDITLDIRDDDSVYTVEKDFSDTCYQINKGDILINTICTDEELVYKTDDLAYGEYTIIQSSNGIGYKRDEKTYNVTISEDNKNPVVILYNQLLKNTIEIEKFACKDNVCGYESGAVFEVRDKNNNLVSTLITNDKGFTKIILGYGSYDIQQSIGLDGYTLSKSFKERIVDEDTEHYNELFNYYIEKEKLEEIKVTKEVEEEQVDVSEDEVLPPKTGVDINFKRIGIKILTIIKKCISYAKPLK